MKLQKSDRQVQAEKRAARVLKLLHKLRDEYPTVPITRIVDTIATHEGMTRFGVVYIAKKAGVYEELKQIKELKL